MENDPKAKLKRCPSWYESLRNAFESTDHKLSETLNSITSITKETKIVKRVLGTKASKREENELERKKSPAKIKSIFKNQTSSSSVASTISNDGSLDRVHKLDYSSHAITSTISSSSPGTRHGDSDQGDEEKSFRSTDEFIKSLSCDQPQPVHRRMQLQHSSHQPQIDDSNAKPIKTLPKSKKTRQNNQHQDDFEMISFLSKVLRPRKKEKHF